jgi:hypothetical protein
VSSKEVSDTLSNRLLNRQISKSSEPSIQIGFIKDAYAHVGCYLVGLPAGRTIVATEMLSMFSGLPLGARPIGMYMPGSRVVVLHFPQLEYGFILGTPLKQVADARVVLPDSLGRPRLGVGAVGDYMHYGPIQDSFSLGNFSVSRPLDTLPGDWGSINDLGVGLLIGRLMALFRASDTAKIEAFWGDDLLRIFGYNLETYTSGSEHQQVDDEGEYNEIVFKAPFAWESLGKRAGPGAGVSTIKDGPAIKGTVQAPIEPAAADQHILPRYGKVFGYLGDLEREWIAAPPQSLTLETFSNQTRYTGLFEQIKSIDGAFALRSAREITLEKTILIPVPKRIKSSEDPTGDNRTNYSAAGFFKERHEKKPFVWGEESANIRSIQGLDYHAWFYNRYSPVGLVAHKKDWYFPEEDGSELGDGTLYTTGHVPGHKFLMTLPQIAEVVIDHRTGHTQKYYRSRSAVRMHDDGSVTIEDGYGSQISMKGGSIFMTAFNDVVLQPGRSLISYAPFDAIVRAGNCVDVSASLGDVRIKAEKNLHVLGGNSGTSGGVLIEDRSTGPHLASDYGEKTGARVTGHGITLKSANSPVQVIGSDVYVGRYKGSAGNLIIDAGNDGSVFVRGAFLMNRATNLVANLIVDPAGGPEEEMFAFNKDGAVLSTNFEVGGSLRTSSMSPQKTGDVIIGGNLTCFKLGIFGDGVYTNGQVAQHEGGNFIAELKEEMELGTDPKDIANQLQKQVDDIRKGLDQLNDLAVSEETSSPGNLTFQNSVGVSMRDTVKDLKLDESFVLYESRWQQTMRANGVTAKWTEPVVEAPSGEKTRPHPGEGAWEQGAHYAEVDLVNVDLKSNKATKREEMTATGAKPVKKSLAEGYLINTQT